MLFISLQISLSILVRDNSTKYFLGVFFCMLISCSGLAAAGTATSIISAAAEISVIDSFNDASDDNDPSLASTDTHLYSGYSQVLLLASCNDVSDYPALNFNTVRAPPPFP
jgi:hypothetical protein